jgi:hypothetical protein
MRIKPPYCYDISSLARQGKNYLAIEIAINMGKIDGVIYEPAKEKAGHGKNMKNLTIIGSIRLYTN